MSDLSDAFNRPIREVRVPSEDELEKLGELIVSEQVHRTELLALSNIRETEEHDRNIEGSEVLALASWHAMSDLIEELVGESDIPQSDDGYSLLQSIGLLSRHAFVQCVPLSFANISACLDSGGDVIAYFSDSLWRGYFEDDASGASGISGMRAVRILSVEDDKVYCADYAARGGAVIRVIDPDTLAWLGKDSWMLEVYK